MENDGVSEKESNVSATINAVSGLAKAIPLYQDALQPAAKELGKSLETVSKAVNVALAPVSALVWGYDKIKDFVDTDVSEKLQNVTEENIITPPAHIAGPALESLKYTGSVEELKELYANLLASSMDVVSTDGVHPSFVEIIKQLSSDEAKLLKYFIKVNQEPIIHIKDQREDDTGGKDYYRNFSILGQKCGLKNPSLFPNYCDNLSRLGLIKIPDDYKLLVDNIYDPLESHPDVLSMIKQIDSKEGRKHNTIHTAMIVTSLGRQFIRVCVQDHRDFS